MRTGILLLLPILCVAAAAQTPISKWEIVKALAPGTEVRVTSAGSKPIVGKIESVSDSELVLKQGAGPQSLPQAQIMSVSVKGKERRKRNALIGLGVGTALGVGIGYGDARAGCAGPGGWCGLDEGVDSAIGGGIGLVVGTLIGVFWPTGGWRKIYAP
jgi:hypothetical protein